MLNRTNAYSVNFQIRVNSESPRSATNGVTLAGASAARIVFNQANAQLFYNSNGTTAGLGTGGQFATLSGVSNLANTDLLVQA